MRKQSTEYSNFKRFMSKMESDKRKQEMLYKQKKNGGSEKHGREKAKNAGDKK